MFKILYNLGTTIAAALLTDVRLRVRAAYRVGTMARFHPGGGTIRQWQACTRLAWRGATRLDLRPLLELEHTAIAVEKFCQAKARRRAAEGVN